MYSAANDISNYEMDERRCLYRRGVTQCHNISHKFSRNMIEIYFMLYKKKTNKKYYCLKYFVIVTYSKSNNTNFYKSV
jgi:hypothetical protein